MRDILKKLQKDKNMLSMSVAIAIVATASLVTTVCLGCNSSNREKAINIRTAAEAQKLEEVMQADIAERSEEVQKEVTKEKESDNLNFATDTSKNCSQVENNNIGNSNTVTENDGNCNTKVINNCTENSNENIQGDSIANVLSDVDDTDNSAKANVDSRADNSYDESASDPITVNNNIKLQNNDVNKNCVNNNATADNAAADNVAANNVAANNAATNNTANAKSVDNTVGNKSGNKQTSNQTVANSNYCFTNGSNNCNTDCDTDCNTSDDKVAECENNNCSYSNVQNIISGNSNCPSSNVQGIIIGNGNCPISNIQDIISGNGNCSTLNIQDILSGNSNYSLSNGQIIISGNNCNQSSQNGGNTNRNTNDDSNIVINTDNNTNNANRNAGSNRSNSTNEDSGTNTNTSTSNGQYSDYVDEVIRLVNIERNKAGLSSLTKDTKLCTVANVRVNEIVTLFSHTRPNGKDCFSVLSEYNITYRTCGENIAWGQTSPAQVVEGWMNSPGHRANILNASFSEIGVGVVYSGGRYYWSQMFLG